MPFLLTECSAAGVSRGDAPYGWRFAPPHDPVIQRGVFDVTGAYSRVATPATLLRAIGATAALHYVQCASAPGARDIGEGT